ncbi:metalloprotease TIKI1 [Lingula anatina]|uniref:Metalloprotease TIKI homolog n=1 Tax=Lingula anatina TaxID=7574 RepID=A0A1S3H0U6_LINAN|nr:metalloprotease TIKI1 [Lingula anatina]|eukprot:XP_013379760.1 metalloprotease TIKI1 [Lingula anatina]
MPSGLLVFLWILLLLQSIAGVDTGGTSWGPGALAHCEHTSDQNQLNSFLWTVKRDPPAYFFGTIHVPYTRVWDFIPENAKQAFRQAQNIFFELDLTDPSTISALATCQMLPHGENLQDVLPQDIYRRLKRHLNYVKEEMPKWMTPDQRGRGLYADYLFNAIAGNWERKRPVWVMLMVNSLTESDIKSKGIPVLDLYLAQQAERMSKTTGAVERVEEQCVPLNELNFSEVVFALNQTLWQHENYRIGMGNMPYTTEDLIKHYNCGDLNSVIFNQDSAQVPNLVNTSLPPRELSTAKNIDNYFRQELIYKRNARMARRVGQLLKQYPDRSFFFAFGAGHFLGNDTIIDHLRKLNFDVEHTQSHETVQRSSKRGRSRPNLLPVAVPDMPADYPLLVDPNVDPFGRHNRRSRKRKNRHRKKKKRRKNKKKKASFNELWVRISTTESSTTEATTYDAKPVPPQTTPLSLDSWYNSISAATAIQSNPLNLFAATLLHLFLIRTLR